MKIGLVGNPNVGKSSIFNNLTGMHQHTGNWPGKTVLKASGIKKYKNVEYLIEDLPGTYSLMAHSKEEEVTRDYIYNEDYDALIIVCDAVCLERNLNLVLQILEITNKVLICVNLMDEAKKKKIDINIERLSKILNVPVIGTCARNKKNINDIMEKLSKICLKEKGYLKIEYDEYLSECINMLKNYASSGNKDLYALNLLVNGNNEDVTNALNYLYEKGVKKEDIETLILESITNKASDIASSVVTYRKKDYNKRDRLIDKIVTHKILSIPFMLMLLLFVFWITIVIANYPSNFLYNMFFSIENDISNFLSFLPNSINNLFVYGIYRVLAWVVSVMLPPMVIFFTLFTLLEDLGYLPRIAFCLDKAFQKCASCGKQALTMIMGFGCNAVGVTGARIIDSPRERLMAILTNCFVPCNGRFPLLISLIAMFLVSNSILKSFILTVFIVIGIFMTFIITKILSKTILKGIPSSFILELPPYRKPQILKVIVRSVFDRSLFVLKRAVITSIPAGIIIWFMANVSIGGSSILKICSNFLDPLASLMGIDGVILLAFILAFPANEIVIPIIIMGYMSLGYLTDISNLLVLKDLFVQNGWTVLTAICVMLFSLIHWPCLTTVLTIKKETSSLKWTVLSIVIPALLGILLCIMVNMIYIILF